MNLPTRWSASNLRLALSNPRILRGELNRVLNEVNKSLTQSRFPDTVSIMDEEWDTLIILDALRPDYLDKYRGEGVTRVISPASNSPEFLRKSFSEEYHDTVYTTGNPHVQELEENTFHAVQHLYKTDWEDDIIPPDNVVSRAVEAHERWPDKRHIVHFMQPHAPFLGKTEIEHIKGDNAAGNKQTIWERLRYGLSDESLEDVRSSYAENVEIGFRAAEDLYDRISGKVVLTADHGELLGDRTSPIPVRGYGHREGYRVKELVEIPWLEFPYNRRRDVVTDKPSEETDDQIEEKELSKRLESLGYL